MTAAAKKPATYADIEALPPDVIGEIINRVHCTPTATGATALRRCLDVGHGHW